MDVLQLKGDVAEVRELVEEYIRPEVENIADPDGKVIAPFVVTKDGIKVIPASAFDDYRDAPRSRKGSATLLTLDSLIEHTNRFKDDDSVLFADDNRTQPSLTSMLDYHRSGALGDPRHGRHRATFAFPLSDEWKVWTKANTEVMKMVEFAEFIEDRVIDVLHITPEEVLPDDLVKFIATGGGDGSIATPQRLVELSRGLQVNEASTVREVIKLSSGEGQVLFQAEHTDANGEPLRIPGLFLIAIPVFRNGPLYRLAARLRYRKTPAGIVFWYDLWRTDRTFDHAFKEACERIHTETALPLLFGTPE